MASRYPIVRLPRWTLSHDLAAFLQGYERACPLRLLSSLASRRSRRTRDSTLQRLEMPVDWPGERANECFAAPESLRGHSKIR
jgi:hypothetical protein